MKLVVHAESTRGVVRHANEDRFLISDDSAGSILSVDDCAATQTLSLNYVVAVADGMGGAEAGKFASGEALDSLRPLVSDSTAVSPLTARVQHAIAEANTKIMTASKQHPGLAGCASDVALFVTNGTDAVLARIGDSTVFVIRDGVVSEPVRQLCWLQFIWCGKPPDSFPKLPPEARSLTEPVCLGTHFGAPASIARFRPREGDRIVLCTDGLTRKISMDEMLPPVGASNDAGTACKSLVAAAMQNGGEDNITVVVCDVVGGERHPNGADDFHSISDDVAIVSNQLDDSIGGVEYVRAVIFWFAVHGYLNEARRIAESVPAEELRSELLRIVDRGGLS